jgi:hypothetical protein
VKGKSLAASLEWIEPEQNPWGIRILDCRPMTLTSTLITETREVADTFARPTDGTDHIGHAPVNASRLDCDLIYPFNGESRDGPLFFADVMEDKWDIYLYDGHVYFVRSWTRELHLRAKIELALPQARIPWIEAVKTAAYEPASFAIRAVDFLMKSHLYRVEVPHPAPDRFATDPTAIAGFSMTMFGRWASFATLEETLGVHAHP